MELWASWDGNDATWPWTDLIVEYIPFEVTMLVIGGLSLWLVVHFSLRYWRKHRASQIASQHREYSPEVTDEMHGRYIDEIKPRTGEIKPSRSASPTEGDDTLG